MSTIGAMTNRNVRARSAALLAILAAVLSSNTQALEEPRFSVVGSAGDLEFRRYEPYLVAETVVDQGADRNKAANAGFRRLFGYISGDNEVQAKISMTAPVRQQPASTKIKMTTPVRQTPSPAGWAIAFIVPSEFDETNVPQPTNPAVRIRKVPEQLVAVVRFSGRWSDSNVERHQAQLAAGLAAAGVKSMGDMVTAFYNSPFSLPFMRRNEVMVQIEDLPAALLAETDAAETLTNHTE